MPRYSVSPVSLSSPCFGAGRTRSSLENLKEPWATCSRSALNRFDVTRGQFSTTLVLTTAYVVPAKKRVKSAPDSHSATPSAMKPVSGSGADTGAMEPKLSRMG